VAGERKGERKRNIKGRRLALSNKEIPRASSETIDEGEESNVKIEKKITYVLNGSLQIFIPLKHLSVSKPVQFPTNGPDSTSSARAKART
jgi:hypothetical protein